MIYGNDGETRWRAMLHAINFLGYKPDGMPIVMSAGDNDLDRLINRWLKNDTMQFDALATARLFKEACNKGATPQILARRIGKVLPNGSPNTAYIVGRIKLLEMPTWLQARVEDGTIVAETAYGSIWTASGEDSQKAKVLLQGAIDVTNERQGSQVKPRDIVKAGGTRTVQTIGGLIEDLAMILKRHDRDALTALLGESDASRLYKLAKL